MPPLSVKLVLNRRQQVSDCVYNNTSAGVIVPISSRLLCLLSPLHAWTGSGCKHTTQTHSTHMQQHTRCWTKEKKNWSETAQLPVSLRSGGTDAHHIIANTSLKCGLLLQEKGHFSLLSWLLVLYLLIIYSIFYIIIWLLGQTYNFKWPGDWNTLDLNRDSGWFSDFSTKISNSIFIHNKLTNIYPVVPSNFHGTQLQHLLRCVWKLQYCCSDIGPMCKKHTFKLLVRLNHSVTKCVVFTPLVQVVPVSLRRAEWVW